MVIQNVPPVEVADLEEDILLSELLGIPVGENRV